MLYFNGISFNLYPSSAWVIIAITVHGYPAIHVQEGKVRLRSVLAMLVSLSDFNCSTVCCVFIFDGLG